MKPPETVQTNRATSENIVSGHIHNGLFRLDLSERDGPISDDIPPLISVITITLNDRDGLIRTIESLKCQENAPPIEHIVVDGGSNYDVTSLIDELNWSAQLHQGQDFGLYDAMNRGMDLGHGEYLLFLNSGDTLANVQTLREIKKHLEDTTPDLLWGDSLERQLEGEIQYKPSRPLKFLPFGMITHHQAMLFRRTVLEKNTIRYNLKYSIAADYDFVLRHARQSSHFKYIPRPICIFECGGTSYQKYAEGRREQFHIRKAAYGSIIFAAGVFVAQVALRTFRHWFPAGYWALRRLG